MKTVLTVFALACLVAGGGCVRRTLTVTSDPPGALVYLNDEEVGRTPVTVPFTWYGTYDVRLEKDGYNALWTKRETEMPWWENPGPDLIAEALPDRKVELAWHFELVPAVAAEDVDLRILESHARQMQESNRRDEIE